MVKRVPYMIFILVLAVFIKLAGAGEMKPGEFLVLCYHSVPVRAVPGDSYSIPRHEFAGQMEYLRTHGYRPVSLDDILMAVRGEKDLPPRPVLLTFDDAYISYYEFVFPFLEKLNYPSVLAVVGKFIDETPEGLPEPLMNWEQIREVSKSRLVEVVSHTYDLHRGIQYNPQGNFGAAASVLSFDKGTESYETESRYRDRIESDFIKQKEAFKEHIGLSPRAVVWPYGRYNHVAAEIARNNGLQAAFTLSEGYASIESPGEINRNLVENEPVEFFIESLKNPEGEDTHIRALQVDLDLIYEDSYEEMDKNLGKLIDRLYEMKVNTVFLQAFADPRGTGNIKSVYFHNSVLPVRADIFSHAAHQIAIRGISVYAWMPVLSIELPDSELNERLKVKSLETGGHGSSGSWYRRLSPFSKEVKKLMRTIYEDLASHSQIHGILFQDDAYLTDMEDFHPAALVEYRKRFGRDIISEYVNKDHELTREWTRYKTNTLIDFTEALKSGVRKYRPRALFARNLYSRVLTEPDAELWFAQDYGLFLDNYDYVVVMAYPQMDYVKRPVKWLKEMVGTAKTFQQGAEKTVYKIQGYDWKKEEWISDGMLLGEMREILSSGGKHLAYYPDNFWDDKPAGETIKLEMSTKTYPFIP